MHLGNRFNTLYDPKFDKKPPKVVLKNGKEICLDEFLDSKFNLDLVEGFRAYASNYIIKLPFFIKNELAYLVGCFLGDGCLKTPTKRKLGGYYCEMEITCKQEYIEIISRVIIKLFNYKPRIKQDKNKKNCWRVVINSKIIYRFLNRVLKIPYGKKSGRLPWLSEFTLNRDIFKNFLAGLIDTDGYRGRYLALIQKDKKFLEKIKFKTKKLLGIEFRGPYINRKIENKIVGWWIVLYKKTAIKDFINKVPLRYSAPGRVMPP